MVKPPLVQGHVAVQARHNDQGKLRVGHHATNERLLRVTVVAAASAIPHVVFPQRTRMQ